MRPSRFVRPLTPTEQAAIADLFRYHAQQRVRRRANAIRLSALGYTVAQIAEVLAAGYQTVHSWIDAFEAEGAAGLIDQPRSGAPPKATPDYRKLLREAVAANPHDLGYPFTVWSVVRLRAHLAKLSGILLGEDRLRQLLKQEGLVFKRPRHTLENKRDKEAFRKVKGLLDELKKTPWTPTARST